MNSYRSLHEEEMITIPLLSFRRLDGIDTKNRRFRRFPVTAFRVICSKK